MARIRSVKPEFFKHEELYEAEIDTGLPLRLSYIGLWCVADREGRFKWRPRQIKLDVLPYDSVDFDSVLSALAERGFVVKYEAGGEAFGFIPKFKEHQVINMREAQSHLPEPSDENTVRAHALKCIQVRDSEGNNIPRETRDTVLARDKHRCLRCGAKEDLTIDHIFPRSMGGTHAITNLRTLCRSCNSARPVAGEALIKDLAKDGLSLEDMQRTCIAVQLHTSAQGEGKGREGKGRGREQGSAPPSSSRPVDSETDLQAACRETWAAYSAAFFERYGTEPVRNATINSQVKQFVQRLGRAEAPFVAAFYVRHPQSFYVKSKHQFGIALKDAEGLRTEWATNRVVTDTQARQSDKAGSNLSAADEAMRILEGGVMP